MRKPSNDAYRRDFLEKVGTGLMGLGIGQALLSPGTAQAATSLADAASLSLNNVYAGEQILDGDAFFGSGKPWFDVQAYGAAGDGTTDDTSAIQSVLNLVSVGTGVPAISIFLPAGTYKITDTLLIQRKAVTLRGAGVGNLTTYPLANPGHGTTIKWEGPAGIPMLKVVDASHCTFEDLLILGDDASPPSEGIYFEQPAEQGSSGTNGITWCVVAVSGMAVDALLGQRWRDAVRDSFWRCQCQQRSILYRGLPVLRLRECWCGDR